MASTMSNGSSALRDTLRQSLQDVLSEVSQDSSMLMATSERAQVVQPRFGLPMSSSIAGAPAAASSPKDYGFFAPGPRSFAMPPTTQMRPSAALGISSEELMLAAAAEKRMLEEKRLMMDLERARVAAMIRQRALEETIQQRRQNGSLLGLFQQGMGNGLGAGFPQDFQAYAQAKGMNFNKARETPKDTLKELGTSLRQKASPYVDVSAITDPDPNDTTVKKTRGGVTEPFPERLHRVLKEVEAEGKDDIVSFYSHGRAFGIHDPERFVSEIMPKFFKQSRLSSFQRQLNLYGFQRINSGPDAGGYYHELFLKGRPNLCLHMRRVGLPKGEDRRKMRSKNVQVDPDFYSMQPVKTTTAGD